MAYCDQIKVYHSEFISSHDLNGCLIHLEQLIITKQIAFRSTDLGVSDRYISSRIFIAELAVKVVGLSRHKYNFLNGLNVLVRAIWESFGMERSDMENDSQIVSKIFSPVAGIGYTPGTPHIICNQDDTS